MKRCFAVSVISLLVFSSVAVAQERRFTIASALRRSRRAEVSFRVRRTAERKRGVFGSPAIPAARR